MSRQRSIAERTAFLGAYDFTDDQYEEIEAIAKWLQQCPNAAAAYICWLEQNQS